MKLSVGWAICLEEFPENEPCSNQQISHDLKFVLGPGMCFGLCLGLFLGLGTSCGVPGCQQQLPDTKQLVGLELGRKGAGVPARWYSAGWVAITKVASSTYTNASQLGGLACWMGCWRSRRVGRGPVSGLENINND